MAPLPANNTDCLFLDYSTSGENHTMQVRWGGSASLGDAMTALDNVLTQVDPLIYLLTVVGARFRNAGTNVTLPIAWSGAATYGSGAGPHYASASMLDFCGRSPGGRRVRWTVFGSIFNADTSGNDYRYAGTAQADVAAAVIELNSATGCFVAIDGDDAEWYNYANLGPNAYWRNRIR